MMRFGALIRTISSVLRRFPERRILLESAGLRSRWEGWSEPGEHAIARRELDEGLRACWESLMIAAEAAPSGDPGNAALDHPSSGKGTEPFWKKRVPLHLGAF